MRLGQILIFTADVPRLTAFYRDTLGLTVLEQADGLARLEGVVLHASKYAASTGAAREDTAQKPIFIADDVAATHARLAAAGIAVRALQQFGDRTGFDAVDPDGNVFRISNP